MLRIPLRFLALFSRFSYKLRFKRNCLVMSVFSTILFTVLLVMNQEIISAIGMQTSKKSRMSDIQSGHLRSGVEVVHILMRLHLSQPNAVHRYQENFEWLLELSTVPLHLHLVVPGDTFKTLDQILKKANETSKTKFTVSKYSYESFTQQLTQLINVDFGQDEEFSKSIAKHMPAMLLPFHFLYINKLIVMEEDIVIRADVSELFSHFRHFAPAQLMGVARQQVPKYRKAFAMYEKYNTASELGKPARPGFNTALLMLDMQKMRHSMKFNAYLHYPSLRWLVHKYWLSKGDGEGGKLTQDDVFTLMGFEHPELFYILPCGWNRQLETAGYNQNEIRDYNQCNGKLYAENVQDTDSFSKLNT